jgi:hypothetical protein
MLFKILNRLFFANLFMSFDGDAEGGAGGGEGASEGGAGSSSSDVNNDVKPETHFADEKGVPWYNRAQELQRKLDGFKDVDLDRYGRLKDFDPDEVEETLSQREKLNSELTQLRDELAKAKAASGGKPTPEVEALRKEIADFKAEQKAEKQKEGQSKWMQEFDTSTEKAVGEILKADAFKDLGGKLSEFEKNSLRVLVDKVYEADSMNKKSLGIKHVPQVVEKVMKMILDNRKANGGFQVRKDQSPQPINGAGNSGERNKAPMTDDERVADSVKFLQEQRAARNAV